MSGITTHVNTKPVKITIHTPDGLIDVELAKVLALTLVPYPVIVLRTGTPGKFKRYVNFPIEFLDEETALAPGDEAMRIISP